LENNGGFSSVRSAEVDFDLSNSDGLMLRVKGDGRTYQMRLGTDARYRSWDVSFSAKFNTKKDSWLNVRIPFGDFKAGFRGRSLGDVTFDSSKIRRFGILLGDKNPGAFRLEIDSISTYTNQSPATILELVKKDRRLSMLSAAISKAGLDEVLGGDGPFTLFAPTNEAFAALPEKTVSELLAEEGLAELTNILKQHVITGSVSLAAGLRAGSVNSLANSPLGVSFENGKIRVNNAALEDADMTANNGIIHIIDSVLTPQEPKVPTILETAQKAGSFKTLLAAVQSAGLTDILDSNEQLTIFAPSDEAFGKLPEGTVEQLLKPENSEQLTSVLINHAVQGIVGAGDALKAGTAETMGNQPLSFKISQGKFQVNGVTVLTADLRCANGVIHVIDRVLLFDDENGKPDITSANADHDNMPPQKKIMAAIQKGVPLYNHGDAAACAEIYKSCIKTLAANSKLNASTKTNLNRSLEMAEGKSADESAWIYRFALDRTLSMLSGHAF
jgi:transforming growth factor-beta-induced protein